MASAVAGEALQAQSGLIWHMVKEAGNSGFTFLWDLHSDATPPFTPHFHPIPSGGRTGMVRQPGVGIAMDRPESSTGKWRRY